MDPHQDASDSDLQAVQELARAYESMRGELATAMFCRGHCLLVGVPGLAKTLLVKTISDVLHLSFKRIQFTPDLMPSDITGTTVLELSLIHISEPTRLLSI